MVSLFTFSVKVNFPKGGILPIVFGLLRLSQVMTDLQIARSVRPHEFISFHFFFLGSEANECGGGMILLHRLSGRPGRRVSDE